MRRWIARLSRAMSTSRDASKLRRELSRTRKELDAHMARCGELQHAVDRLERQLELMDLERTELMRIVAVLREHARSNIIAFGGKEIDTVPSKLPGE